MAQRLSMLCLYRKGYDFKRLLTLSEYYDRDRSAYYRAIQGVREKGLDLTAWLEYFTNGLSSQLAEVQERGESLIRLDVLTNKHKLTARQRVAIELAMQAPEFRVEYFAAIEDRIIQLHKTYLTNHVLWAFRASSGVTQLGETQ